MVAIQAAGARRLLPQTFFDSRAILSLNIGTSCRKKCRRKKQWPATPCLRARKIVAGRSSALTPLRTSIPPKPGGSVPFPWVRLSAPTFDRTRGSKRSSASRIGGEDDIAVTLPDGRHIPATRAGRDRGTDLAVLRIASGSLPVATLGDPATLRPGHLVLARARLDEGGPRAAFGAVSATGGKWRCWKGGEIDRRPQSDLEVYPGFGGGPLADATGRIHGVNSGGLSRTLATTIPVVTVNRVMAQLLERGYVARGWIGAAMQPVQFDPTSRQRLKHDGGLLLLSVEPDAPASRAGLLIGDVIVAVDGHSLDGVDQLLDVLGGDVVGKTLRLEVVRAGQPVSVDVVIGERSRRAR